MRFKHTAAAVVAASATGALATTPGAVIDPFGDAVDTFGAGGPIIDIDTLDVRYDALGVSVTMTFHSAIAPASAGLGNSVAGFIEFDTDQNAATGADPFQNGFDPYFERLGLGVDVFCDLSSELGHAGYIDVISAETFNVVATVPVVFTENSLSFSITRSELDDDGRLDFTAIVGSFAQPTDALNVVGRSVPAPAGLALGGVGALVGARRRR